MVWIDFGWALLEITVHRQNETWAFVHDYRGSQIYVVWVRLKDAYPYEWGCVSPGGNAE